MGVKVRHEGAWVETGGGGGGDGSIPLGGIIMWSGTIATIPSGWALCDGNNGTPNLTNKFVVCAADDSGSGVTFNAGTGAESGDYAPGDTGGSTAHQLTEAELASHDHPATFSGTGSVLFSTLYGNVQGGSGGGNKVSNSGTVNVSNAGSDNYHENRPPYYALAYIMKI